MLIHFLFYSLNCVFGPLSTSKQLSNIFHLVNCNETFSYILLLSQDPESYVSSESTARVSNFASDDALTVTTAKDIEIFINLVEFCRFALLQFASDY